MIHPVRRSEATVKSWWKRPWSWVLLIGAVFVVILAVEEGKRRFSAPWSYGDPSLTGVWYGPLEARLGAKYQILLELEYYEPSRPGRRRGRGGGSSRNLSGTAKLCSPRGAVFDFELSGRADRDARDVRILIEYVDPSQSALDMDLVGAWGGRTLALRTNKNPFDPDGSFRPVRTTSSADPDDSFAPIELRKGSAADFESACRQLAA
jgi:hypothetical protein